MYAFDLLFIDGKSLVELPFLERREILWSRFQKVEGQFDFATSKDPESVEEVEEFLDDSLKGTFLYKYLFLRCE